MLDFSWLGSCIYRKSDSGRLTGVQQGGPNPELGKKGQMRMLQVPTQKNQLAIGGLMRRIPGGLSAFSVGLSPPMLGWDNSAMHTEDTFMLANVYKYSY